MNESTDRHDPFAHMRGAPWMNRKLSPSRRAAAFLRRELEDFPAIEGREPNHADLDAIVKRTVNFMVPIFKREQAMDFFYDVPERREETLPAPAPNEKPAVPPTTPGLPQPAPEGRRRQLDEYINPTPRPEPPPAKPAIEEPWNTDHRIA